MAVHIGKIIQAEVEYRRLTQKEFGTLINKNEKTVPDIYHRATMSIDLLIAISAALKKDFLSFFYNEEPLKDLRNDEIVQLNNQIKKITEENKQLQKELTLTQDLNEAQKEIIFFAKEQLEDYKSRLKELLDKMVAKTAEQIAGKTDPVQENKV